jgi:hypothetical protein
MRSSLHCFLDGMLFLLKLVRVGYLTLLAILAVSLATRAKVDCDGYCKRASEHLKGDGRSSIRLDISCITNIDAHQCRGGAYRRT